MTISHAMPDFQHVQAALRCK